MTNPATDAPTGRILVVDDQPENVALLERMLARGGYTDVAGYTDPLAALAAIEVEEPDLVLLDLHMPTLDGFAVLERIRARDPERFLPVLVLTGDVDRAARQRALAAGANDFLSKPFDLDEVLLRCRNLLTVRRLHEALRRRTIDLAEELETTEREWAAVAESLQRLAPTETAEAIVEAVCRELIARPGIDLVGVLELVDGDLRVLALRARGIPVGEIPSPEPAAAADLRARAFRGPWLEPVPGGAITSVVGALAETLRLAAAACVPLQSHGRPVALLLAGSGADDAMAVLARRLPAIEAFGAVAGAILGPALADRHRDDARRATIERIIAGRAFRPVFQPVVELETGRIVGYEALTRFGEETPPDRVFADAAACGLGRELELATLEAALAVAERLPPDVWLSLNVSPDLVLAGADLRALLGRTNRSLVVEMTEHTPVADYPALRAALADLGDHVRTAVDDAGAGWSSFRHIVELEPDFVKIDIGLVRAIERDRARQAFVAGLDYFSLKTGCSLIAEGIETEAERTALRSLAVSLGQGYLLGRPAPLPN
jgi:EAL domain-containing protein (putative c-di-GMP-specific phosphodiesterase class I)/DNA-binding response OmpR family regulator